MKKTTTLVASIVLAAALQGCGSILATIGTGPKIYGGVKLEASYLVNVDSSAGFWLSVPFVLLDFPLSGVMDTLFLPWTALVAADEEMRKP